MMLANYGESNQQLVLDICPRGIKKNYGFHRWAIKGKTLKRKSVKLKG
jgi:hypothetical protein